MAGHSKWANIKHRKERMDSKRGKTFSRLVKETTIAAKVGGPDPGCNPRLRLALEKAREANVPNDNLERAIKRGSGQLEGVDYMEVRYEGYGPGGAAVIVDCLTDNKNRRVRRRRLRIAGRRVFCRRASGMSANAQASASAASAGAGTGNASRRITISLTCFLLARPMPVTDFLICRAEISVTSKSHSNNTPIATPRASPNTIELLAFLLTNTRSIQAIFGLHC